VVGLLKKSKEENYLITRIYKSTLVTLASQSSGDPGTVDNQPYLIGPFSQWVSTCSVFVVRNESLWGKRNAKER